MISSDGAGLSSAADPNCALGAAGRPRTGVLLSPEEFFGFRMGEDGKLAGWDRLLEYYRLLARGSDRVELLELGNSTAGWPFVILFISSPENLARLEHYRQINSRLGDPRGLAEEAGRALAREGKVVLVQSFGLHSDEVASAQTAAEFAYESITREDEAANRIRDAVISILMPSLNPDGTQMVADWYAKYVGTEYEGTDLPWLYHVYAGHDNNRDGFTLNLVESQYFAKVVYRDWLPQAFVDHHQMYADGARMSIPPYAEPMRPNTDPLVWREMAWFGGQMGTALEAADKRGVVSSAIFPGWAHTGFHSITALHNIAGMLTESASTKLATPVFLHATQMRGGVVGMPAYQLQATMPSLWPGGWWRLRDIVDQQMIASWSVLDLAARNRESLLWNMFLKATRQIERGRSGPIKGYVIDGEQHDVSAAKKLVNMLIGSGVEVHHAEEQFAVQGRLFKAGSFIVSLAQPKQGLVRAMLGRTHYPDNVLTRDAGGNPSRPLDLATDGIGEFMGLRMDAIAEVPTAKSRKLMVPLPFAGSVAHEGAGRYVLACRSNDSFRAVFELLRSGVRIQRARGGEGFSPGDFIITDVDAAILATVAQQTGVAFDPLNDRKESGAYDIRASRVGLFRRYGGGSMDEGWTRLLFDQFSVPYGALTEKVVKEGNLNEKFDVIVLPDDSPKYITGESMPEIAIGRCRPEETPPEFRSGFGSEGIAALQFFVRAGGTLVTICGAGELPLNYFELPVKNIVAELGAETFWCPGSTLRARFDIQHPLAYGMPAEGWVLFSAGATRQHGGGQVYEVTSVGAGHDVSVICRYADRDILQSGWLQGEQSIAGKAAAVTVRCGKGRLVLIGFRAQHRCQAHGTFKVIFNTLLSEGDTGVPPVRGNVTSM